MEAYFDWEHCTSNPVDGIGVMATGGSLDPRQVDHLVTGQGASGTRHATFPEQHCRAYVALQKGRFRRKQLGVCFVRSQGHIMMRCLQAGVQAFLQSTHVAISFDGTRLGQRDILNILLVAKMPNGRYAAMWAPPQAASKYVIEPPRV